MERIRNWKQRFPRVEFRPGAAALLATFVVATALALFDISLEAWVAYASAGVTAFGAGWLLLKVDGYRLHDLPRVVRLPVQVIGLGSLWLLASHIYEIYLRSGFDAAYHTFVITFAIPYAQGLFIGFLYYSGVLLLRRSPSQAAESD
ncbi:MAG: hypothetical protein WD269_01345 [Acidimicrobiia bacterium]